MLWSGPGWRPASPCGRPAWHHSHYLCVCMLLFQFSSHWAANNLKQQGYSLTALSGESPCLSLPDLSPASEVQQQITCVWTYPMYVYRWLRQSACDGKGGMCVWGQKKGSTGVLDYFIYFNGNLKTQVALNTFSCFHRLHSSSKGSENDTNLRLTSSIQILFSELNKHKAVERVPSELFLTFKKLR